MDAKNFPWTPEQDPSENSSEEFSLEELEKTIKKKERMKLLVPSAIVIILFSLLLIFGPEKREEKKVFSIPKTEVLVSMIPILKGESIDPQTLKLISVSSKTMTRKQVLQLLRPTDAVDLEGKLFAKRDIAPHQPITWTDLQYQKHPPVKRANPKIYFGGK